MSGCSGDSCSSCSSCSSGDGKDDVRLPPGMLDRYDLDQSTADGALVWLEVLWCPDGPKISGISMEVLSAVCGMNEGRTFAVMFGGPELKPLYRSIFGCGVGSIYHVRDKGSECYDSNVYSITLCDIIERVNPAVVAMGSTERGEQIAEKTSKMLGTPLYSKCASISMDGRNLRTEPAPLEQFLITKKKRFPQVATVVKGAYPAPEQREGQGTAIYWQTWKER
ncbi:electron transfer flavoprotein domain-containing protein [methanogenic archaeon mixed culture ISO4-G1]|nr:electron transfer flavoprotein domain-containing protein [methanogenic archaeon mixed culture ISO4-G1]